MNFWNPWHDCRNNILHWDSLKTVLAKEEITILHCNTEYPTPDWDVNVLVISELHKHFPEYSIGFSCLSMIDS